MNIDQLKELIKLFNDSSITNMDLEFEDIKLKLNKEKEIITSNIDLGTIIPTTKTVVKEETTIIPEASFIGQEVKSPIVGTYYDKRSPDSPAFVEEGEFVKEGQVLCIVEAMKVMNEIIAPCSGKLIKKTVHNEEFVEYNQVLMIIE
jgi:Biotin carboxyl carrier protein